jgi:hypothetical protein
VAVSSLLPPLLAAAAALLLSCFTRHAAPLFTAVTVVITAASLLPGLSSALPDGTPKAPGFDALVLPMHLVVGGLSAWLISRALRG